MPQESNPIINPEDNIYVVGLRSKMKEGFSLEEAVASAEEEIEKSKDYDSAYPQQKALLQKGADYLKSLEKK